jgi:predicted tellurium resistance membrane protein TerC
MFGLGLSIPFVVFTSNLLSQIMERYPIIIVVGAAILGRVGGEMIITDPYITQMMHPPKWLEYGMQAVLAVAVVVAGRWVSWRRISRKNPVLAKGVPHAVPRTEAD